VTINNLLPGAHDTDRIAALEGAMARAQNISIEEAGARRRAENPTGRYGTITEFGNACAFLCSQHAGFIVGQNILLDGGAINATI
jgi:3-oxoacyl-[acyl-carrier protein] reductase